MSKKLTELLSKIQDESVRNEIQAEAQVLVKELGTRGQDLIDLKQRIADIEKNAPDTSYAEAHKALKALNLPPKDIAAALKKMKLQASVEDELEILKSKVQEETTLREGTQKELLSYKNKDRLQDLLPKVSADFKDLKGNPINVAQSFLKRHMETLHSNLSEDPVVAAEQVKKAFTSALQEQEVFVKDLGYQGSPIPKVPGSADFNSRNGITPPQLQEIAQKQGLEYAFAAKRQAEQPG
jgi:hypothetical protein